MRARIEAELRKHPGRILNANGSASAAGQQILQSIRMIVKEDLEEAAERGNADVPS